MTVDWDNVQYFSESEFKCKCDACQGSNEPVPMDPLFIQFLDGARHKLGWPFIINSGYRCSEHNEAVSGSGTDGPHTTGKAADIRVADGRQAYELVREAVAEGLRFGLNRKSNGQGFVHVDSLKEKDGFTSDVAWSY